MSSPEFYDNFISYQIESGVNDRIYDCYKRMKKQGINNNSSVLEIGCGIGVLTYLLSRKIKKGVIEAIDLIEKSVDYAKKQPLKKFYSTKNDLFYKKQLSNLNEALEKSFIPTQKNSFINI